MLAQLSLAAYRVDTIDFTVVLYGSANEKSPFVSPTRQLIW